MRGRGGGGDGGFEEIRGCSGAEIDGLESRRTGTNFWALGCSLATEEVTKL